VPNRDLLLGEEQSQLSTLMGRASHNDSWQKQAGAFSCERPARVSDRAFLNVLLDPQHRHRIDQHSPNFGRAHRRRWSESFRGSQTGRWLQLQSPLRRAHGDWRFFGLTLATDMEPIIARPPFWSRSQRVTICSDRR
jgi:hypothetical protein